MIIVIFDVDSQVLFDRRLTLRGWTLTHLHIIS